MVELKPSDFDNLCQSLHHMMEYEYSIGLGEAFTEHSVKKFAVSFLNNWKRAQTGVRCEYRTPEWCNKVKNKGRKTSIDIAIVHDQARRPKAWPDIETAIELKKISADTTHWYWDTWRLAALKSDVPTTTDFPEVKPKATRYMIIFGESKNIHDFFLRSTTSSRSKKRLWYLPWDNDWIVSGEKNNSICSLKGKIKTEKYDDVSQPKIGNDGQKMKITTRYFESWRCSWMMGMQIIPMS